MLDPTKRPAAEKRRQFANEVAIQRRFGLKRRRGRLPRQMSPKAIAVEYAHALRTMFRAAMEVYRPLLNALQVRTDASDFSRKRKREAQANTRPGASEFSPAVKLAGREAKRLLDEAETRLEGAISRTQIETLASKFAARTSTYQRMQLGRQVRAAVGADPYVRDPVLAGVTEDFVAQNVSLIKRIPRRLHEKIEGLVMNSVGKSELNINLAEEIQRQFGVAERHAIIIARDQVTKYYGAVNRARQEELGVTRFIWRTVNDERVRDRHAELEGEEFSWDDLPTNDKGEEIFPGSEIQCFPGNTPISTNAAVKKIFRRTYVGDCTVLTTDNGGTLRATPNHPILTNRGWLPAQFVDVGDYVFEAASVSQQLGVEDGEHAQATIQEVFDALVPFGRVQKARAVHGRFHGDTSDEEVDVVDVDGGLFREGDPEFSETFCQQLLVLANDARSGQGPLALAFDRMDAASCGVISLGGKLATLLLAGTGHALEHRGAAVAWFDTVADKLTTDGCARDVEVLREALHRPAVQEQGPDLIMRIVAGVVRRAIVAAPRLDTPSAEMLAEVVGVDTEDASRLYQRVGLHKMLRVVEKGVRKYSGHVYNLETTSGWYVAEGLVVHNCRCSAEPVLDDVVEEVREAEGAMEAPQFPGLEEPDEETDEDEEQE